MTANEQSFDFICVGSGGGGLVAGLAAHDAGLKPLIVEKQGHVGGSTGMSGGVIWMPANPLMRAEGVHDSLEEGLTYFDSVVGKPDQGSSLERRRAFLTQGPEMLSLLMRKRVKLVRCEGYPDYYDNLAGGNVRGRAVEGIPWDGHQLGEWHDKIIPGMARGLGMTVKTNEGRKLATYMRAPTSFVSTAHVVGRTYLGRWRKQDLFTSGMSLIGQLTKAVLDAGIPIWLSSGVEELIIEGDRVVGVRVVRNGTPVIVRATRGVLLSAGGFERNPEMRLKYNQSTQPNDGSHTIANQGNTGEVLEAAIALGAKVDYMDEAVWYPTPRFELGGSALSVARGYPRTMVINKQGRRFTNEANSYVAFVRAMYANDAIPAWLIFDDGFRRRYPWVRGMPSLRRMGTVIPGRMPTAWVTNGWVKKSDTIEGLAGLLGVPVENVVDTVHRFNQDARNGRDLEFGRGASQYNKAMGDPGNKPNQSLGPVAEGPFYATEIFPGDVGTSGGVITDEYARVLDQSDTPIAGLYATGNMTATVTGRFYLGAGSSIANTTVFGYIAAHHAARQG